MKNMVQVLFKKHFKKHFKQIVFTSLWILRTNHVLIPKASKQLLKYFAYIQTDNMKLVKVNIWSTSLIYKHVNKQITNKIIKK